MNTKFRLFVLGGWTSVCFPCFAFLQCVLMMTKAWRLYWRWSDCTSENIGSNTLPVCACTPPRRYLRRWFSGFLLFLKEMSSIASSEYEKPDEPRIPWQVLSYMYKIYVRTIFWIGELYQVTFGIYGWYHGRYCHVWHVCTMLTMHVLDRWTI